MKIISMRICPYVQQVRVVLEAKNAKYEVEHIEGGAPRPDWLLEASPDGGEVPLLITDGGENIFQSDTIVEYIDESMGNRFLSGTPLEIARDRSWGRLAADNYLTQCSTQRSPDEETLKERMEDLTPIFAGTESHLQSEGQAPYFHGENLSLVDLSWIPLLHRTGIINDHTGYDFLNNFPRLQAWRAALLDTDLQDRSVSSDFLEIFTGFYLNEETFLGRKRLDR